jgi:hypothetical protein
MTGERWAMRLHVSALLIAILGFGAAAAQAQTFGAGVRVGIDISSLPGAGQVVDQIVKQPSTETSAKTGVLVGGFVTIPIRERLAFEPELQFVTKGVNLTEAGNAGTASVNLRYLEFPMLARYTMPLDDPMKLYGIAGPTFAVKAGVTSRVEAPNLTSDVDVDPAIRTFDAGFAFGGGIEYGQYFIEGRYTLGLTDVAAEAYPHASSIKNRSFAISGGIRFK